MKLRREWLFVTLVVCAAQALSASQQKAAVPKPALMMPGELEKLPARPPDHRIA